MREIKFRAWDNTTKKMIPSKEFASITFSGGDINIIQTWDSNMFYDYVLMQYTGLKDKNKKEAYIKDIATDGINPPFAIEDNYALLARLSEIEFEILGNIYENPELLKEKE